MFLRKKIISLAVTALLNVMILAGCSNIRKEPVSREMVLLGTICNIRIYDKVSNDIFDKAFDRIREIEQKASLNIADSEVNFINNSAGEKAIKVSDDVYKLISYGVQYGEKSEGRFDISIGPLVKLWGIGSDKARVPSEQEIVESKALVNYRDIIFDDNNKSVMLKNKGMEIDLGGIAKGYVADEVAEVLSSNGVKHAIINLGGNVFVMNNHPEGRPWSIGIQDPFLQRGERIGNIKVENKSVVTSGIYERYLEKDGIKYHHILSPFSGYPFDNEIAGISIISDKSIDGDALSTSVFAMGVQEGLKFIEKIAGIEAVFVTKDKEVYITKGLKGNFNLENNEFKLMN